MIIACMATQLTNIIIIMHGCTSIAIHANPWPLQWEVGSSGPHRNYVDLIVKILSMMECQCCAMQKWRVNSVISKLFPPASPFLKEVLRNHFCSVGTIQ